MITKAPDLFWKQNHVTSQQPRGLCWEPQLIFSSHKRNSPTAASLQTSCRDRTLQSLRTLTQFCGFNSQTLYIRRRALKRTRKREEETHLTFKWRQLAPLHRHGATRPLRAAGLGFPPQSLRCRRRGLTLSRSLGTKLQRPKISGTKHFSTVISYLTLAAAIFSLLLLRLPVKLHTALRR